MREFSQLLMEELEESEEADVLEADEVDELDLDMGDEDGDDDDAVDENPMVDIDDIDDFLDLPDDAIDIDQNYSGTIDNFYVIQGGDGTDEALEIDGPEGSANNTGTFTFDRGYIVGAPSSTSSDYAVFKSNAQGTLQNVHFTNFNAGAKVKVNGSTELDFIFDT